MSSTFRKIAFSTVCTCILFSANATKSQAGVITDVWGAVFSPPGTPYFPSFRNSFYRASYQPYAGSSYSSGYYPGAQTMYRSRVSYRYSPRRGYRYRATYRFRPFFGFGAPSNYTSYYNFPGYNYPVYESYIPSASNPCGMNAASRNAAGKLKPSPQTAAIPKTFSNKPNTADTKSNDTKSKDTNGKSDREKQDSFKKTRTDKQKNDDTGAEELQTFKIPSRNQKKGKEVAKKPEKKEELFPLKKPAPTKSSKSEKKSNGPRLVSTQVQHSLPNFDRKITWRATPQKTRLVLKSFVKNEKISRSKYVPKENRGWKPQTHGKQVASK